MTASYDGTAATVRSDIYSLAAILYEALTGRRTYLSNPASPPLTHTSRRRYPRPGRIYRGLAAQAWPASASRTASQGA